MYLFLKNLPIPIMHRDFFKMISQKPEHVNGFRRDRVIPFHFPRRKWILKSVHII